MLRNLLSIIALLISVSAIPLFDGVCEEAVFRPTSLSADSAEGRREDLVQRIDSVLQSSWDRAGVQPAALASDSEFLRRAYLDLNGVIPRVSEVRSFLKDDRPDKRQRLVERLLRKTRYATHMVTVWRNRILPPGAEEAHPRESRGLQAWLHTRFTRNLRYDGLAAELLLELGNEDLGPALFFQVHDLAPEKIAASVSELFLGVELQCAQCHDHPYSEFSQRDFWGLAAFFARVQVADNRGMGTTYRLLDVSRGEVRLPGSDQIVGPKYLLCENEVDESFGSRRESLVLWLTSRDNPFFAHAGANWAWSHMFGRGLVDSLDRLPQQDESINKRLLDDLADYFVASGFDLRELFRVIACTRAYQLSSWSDLPERATSDLFAHMVPRPLTPDQLYDSFLLLAPRLISNHTQAVGVRDNSTAGLAADPIREEFVRRMREPAGDATEYRAGTLQALMMMNGVVTAELTHHDRSRLLGALTAPFMDSADQIEALFLATLCRRPDDEELGMALAALDDAETEREQSQVLSDILWALLNSTEFAFNR